MSQEAGLRTKSQMERSDNRELESEAGSHSYRFLFFREDLTSAKTFVDREMTDVPETLYRRYLKVSEVWKSCCRLC